MNDMTLKTAGTLFELRTIGLIARMVQLRGVEPTKEHWEFLLGKREITSRDLGEISYELGFQLHLYAVPCEAESANDQTEMTHD